MKKIKCIDNIDEIIDGSKRDIILSRYDVIRIKGLNKFVSSYVLNNQIKYLNLREAISYITIS
jgi:hypothetical protein